MQFAFLVGIPTDFANSAVGLDIYAINAGIKTYKAINDKYGICARLLNCDYNHC